jgi:hypothetical protein
MMGFLVEWLILAARSSEQQNASQRAAFWAY